MTSTPPNPDPPESIGSYQVKRKLGAGGMGEVFLAYDDRLRRNVAIKKIRAGVSMSPEQRERLRREARAAAALSHPSIVQVYDIIEDDGVDAIVMEYLEGRTLWDMITDGELDGPNAINVLVQVADGLEAAHKQGLVHRDLKGENVIIDEAGNGKILDFGVAKSNEPLEGDQELTTAGMAVGTYRSMSPEQCEGRPVDARSDLFALGVLMYEMFAGRTPFAGKTPLHTLANVVGFEPPTVLELNRSLPAEISALIEHLLEKNPQDRPTSAAAVADTLEEFQDPSVAGGIVMPRLTATPDSGIDPIGSRALARRASPTRLRRRTTAAAPTKKPGNRIWWLLGAGVLAAAVGSITLLQRTAQGEPGSPNRVVVFPLVPGSGATPSTGEDVATMIGTALDGTAPLDWIDGWTLLEGDARDDVSNLSVARMASLARSRDAGFFVQGRVIVSGDEANVVLTLHDSEDGDEVTRKQGTGPPEYPWRAGLQAVNGILPHLIPTAVPDVEARFAARPPLAVAEFLLGEQAFRRVDMDVALTHFQASFAADSTFPLAAIRGAAAASWEHAYDEGRELLRSVLRQPLEPKTETFARGLLSYLEYDAEGAIESLTSALQMDTALTVAWAALGEVYRHRAPREPWLDGVRPHARALAQDSAAGYVLFHSLETVMRDGDLESARLLRERFLAGDPDPSPRQHVNLMFQCLESGPLAPDWESEVRQDPSMVEFAGGQFLIGARNLPCAEAMFRSILVYDTTRRSPEPRYWSGLLGLAGSKLAKKQFDDARRLIEGAAAGYETFQSLVERSTVTATGVVLPEDDAPWVPRDDVPLRDVHEGSLLRWSEFAVLAGAVYPQLDDLAARAASDLRETVGPDFERPAFRTTIWMLGLWEALHGRPDQAFRAAARIREMAEGRDEFERPYTLRMAEALEIHGTIAAGDTAGGLASLRALRANASEGPIFVELIGSLAYERLVHARLEEQFGDPQRALNLVLGFDEPSSLTYIVFLPPGLATCVRTANRLGRASKARECNTLLATLGWSAEDW